MIIKYITTETMTFWDTGNKQSNSERILEYEHKRV